MCNVGKQRSKKNSRRAESQDPGCLTFSNLGTRCGGCGGKVSPLNGPCMARGRQDSPTPPLTNQDLKPRLRRLEAMTSIILRRGVRVRVKSDVLSAYRCLSP